MTGKFLTIAILALPSLLGAKVVAQQSSRSLFYERSHDFGVVARASKAEYHFTVTNPYREDLHFRSVRTSCGCTTPIIVKETLKPGETGSILARFNTRSFLGKRRATLTVTMDRPHFAEVQLNISGYIRRDVVLDPGEVDFGQVPILTTKEQKVQLRYAGKSDWQIVDIKSSNPNIEAESRELGREGGQVEYELSIRLTEGSEPGYLQDELILQTNDRLSDCRLMVRGRVVAPLTVNPASVFMGVVKPGEQVTKQLVVRGATPFRITRIDCPNDCFEFESSDEAKSMHLIPVRFTAGSSSATVSENVMIETDLDEGAKAGCVLTATVSGSTSEEK